MHMMAVLDAIKKRDHFNNHDKAQKAHDEAKQAVASTKVGLALLNRTSTGEKIARRRCLQRPRKPQRKPL
jgi:hypothetical protein